MADDLHSKVSAWLGEQGFPLEMEAASLARDAGFEVSQSDYYVDPETKEAREIDLVLSRHKFIGGNSLKYTLLVECKSSRRDKPWLVFCAPNELAPPNDGSRDVLRRYSVHSTFIANDYGESLLLKAMYGGETSSIFPTVERVEQLGYGVTQAFAQGSDAPFKAVMSAAKASLAEVSRYGVPGLSVPFVFAVPVIVIDVPLLLVSRSPTGELLLSEAGHAVIHWKRLVASRSRIGVSVVTLAAFADFLRECQRCAEWWLGFDQAYLAEIVKESNKQSSPRQ